MTDAPDKARLFKLVVLGVMLAGCIAVGILAATYYRHQARSLLEAADNQLLTIAELKAKELTHWLRERESDARFYQHNPAFQRMVRNFLHTAADPGLNAELETWLRDTQASHHYEILLLDAAEAERLLLPAGIPGPAAPETAGIRQALATASLQWVDFFRHDATGNIRLTLVIPLKDTGGLEKPLAVMLWRMNPHNYIYPLLNTWPIPSETAETLLVRREGDRVLYLSPLRLAADAPLTLSRPLSETGLPAALAVQGAHGIIHGRDYRGRPVLAASEPIAGTGWSLLSRIDRTETDRPLQHQQRTILIQAGTLMLALLGLAGLGWRQSQLQHLLRLERGAEQLRESQARLTSLLDASPTIIYQLRWKEGSPEPLYVSPNLERLTGHTVTEAVSPGWWEQHLHVEDRARALQYVGKILNQDRLVHAYRFTRKDGRTLWIRDEMRMIRDASGRPAEVVGVWTDITDEKQRLDELHLQSAALEAATNAIVITNLNGKIEWANAAFTKLTGYTLGEVIHRNPRELVKSGRQSDDFYRDLWAAILAGKPWSGELVNRRKNGALYTEEMMITPVQDAGGRITHFIAVKQDVTQRNELQEKFFRAQRLESLGMLAAGIAHDLNNMLAPVMFAGPLLRRTLRDPQELKIVAMLENSAERGASLVKQVLAFAKGGTNELRFTQLKHVARDVLAFVQNSFPKSIRIESKVATDAWPVRANPTQIHQLILNLCVNARDAMPNGGTLTVTLGNQRLSPAEAEAIPQGSPGDWLLIEVTDTGTGIPPDVLPHIYDAFFSTKPKEQGTGLGLNTVRTIVQTHHGFTTVQTAVGHGTTFRVHLPAAAGPATAEDKADDPEVPRGHGELILLVDDDDAVRTTIADILNAQGYRVLACEDGVVALVNYHSRAQEINLVITDVDMPNLNGAILAGTLRQLRPELGIIGISGAASSQSSRLEELKAIAHAFISKPFAADELLRTVHRVLERKI